MLGVFALSTEAEQERDKVDFAGLAGWTGSGRPASGSVVLVW